MGFLGQVSILSDYTIFIYPHIQNSNLSATRYRIQLRLMVD